LKFKRLHLLQQAEERKAQETMKIRAMDDRDNGNPRLAYILIDGMTVYSGNTPKSGGGDFRRSKSDNTFVTNRVIGCEVICGPINTTFLYHTDNLVGGGANTMVEVVRQVLYDLSLELHKLNLLMPRELSFQFDNCGENKNKVMFAHLSLLIESHFFDKINVNFLIVGHTHTSIDQYFGVLTDLINKSFFIGSPLSLQNLLMQAHKDPSQRPTVNKQILIVRDYKNLYKPYTNANIHYFQFPHCFVIFRLYGKAMIQYKLFSTHKVWLPLAPAGSLSIPSFSNFEEVMRTNTINLVELDQLSIVDGVDCLSDAIGAPKIQSLKSMLKSSTTGVDESVNNMNMSDISGIVENQIIKKIEYPSMVETLKRFEDAEDRKFNEEGFARYNHLSTNAELSIIEQYLNTKNTSNREGYMMWLLFTSADLLDLTPEPTYPIDLIEECIKELPQDESVLFQETSIFADDSTGRYTDRLQSQRKVSAPNKSKLKSSLMKGVKEIVSVARYVQRQLNPTAPTFASHKEGYK